MECTLPGSGINLSAFEGTFCWYQHGNKHVLRAQELADWIVHQRNIFGNVTKHHGVTHKDFKDKLGILFFRNFWGTGNQGDHIDLWNGKTMPQGSLDYFNRAEEIWFWQL